MIELAAFEKGVASPLGLAGFGLLIFALLARRIISSSLLQPISRAASERFLTKLIFLCAALGGLALAGGIYLARHEQSASTAPSATSLAAEIADKLAATRTTGVQSQMLSDSDRKAVLTLVNELISEANASGDRVVLEDLLREMASGKLSRVQDVLEKRFEKRKEEAATSNKQAVTAAMQAGLVFSHTDLRRAEYFFGQATQLDSRNVESWFRLGRVRTKLGNSTEAKRAYLQVLTLERDSEAIPLFSMFAMSSIALLEGNLGHMNVAEKYMCRSNQLAHAVVRRLTFSASSKYGCDPPKLAEIGVDPKTKLDYPTWTEDLGANTQQSLSDSLARAKKLVKDYQIADAEALLRRTIKEAEAGNYFEILAEANAQLSVIQSESEREDLAEHFARASLHYARQVGSKHDELHAMHLIANVFQRTGRFENAMYLDKRIANEFRLMGDDLRECVFLIQAQDLLRYLKKPADADALSTRIDTLRLKVESSENEEILLVASSSVSN